MPEDNIIHKISWRYAVEPLSGKENTYILRRRDGLILVFIEKVNNHIVSVRYHQTRNLPQRLLNYLAKFIISSGWTVSTEAAGVLGISIIRSQSGAEHYISFPELKNGSYVPFLGGQTNKVFIINSLSAHNLSIPSGIQGLTLETMGAKIKKLKIGSNVQAYINLRDNHLIRRLLIGSNFTGKIALSNSDITHFVLGDDANAEISYMSGGRALSFDIGNRFQGSLLIRGTYLSHLTLGAKSQGHIKLERCISLKPISVGASVQSHIECSSVVAPYIYIGDNFSGYFEGRSRNAEQGVRRLFVGSSFSGHIDCSNSKNITRIDFGALASGRLELISCPSVRVVKFGAGFSGSDDFRESSIVYVRALSPCQGEMIFGDCKMLTLLKLPLDNQGKIIGSGKPLQIIKKHGYAYFYFNHYILPRSYFSSIWDILFPPKI